ELAARERRLAVREREPGRRGLGLLGAPAAALGTLPEALAQALVARRQRLRDRIVEDRLEAAQARHLGDPRAHGAGADDSDPPDRHPPGGAGGSSPSE